MNKEDPIEIESAKVLTAFVPLNNICNGNAGKEVLVPKWGRAFFHTGLPPFYWDEL